MLLRLSFVLLSLLLLANLHSAELVKLVNMQGKLIEAEIIGVNESFVSIKRKDGRTFDIQRDSLSTASRLQIDLWSQKQELEDRLVRNVINFNSQVTFDTPPTISERKVKFATPTIRIKNPNQNREFNQLTATLIVIGKASDRPNTRNIIEIQTSEIVLSAGGTTIWEGSPFNIFSVDNNYNSPDQSIEGHILVVQDSKDTVIYKYGTSPSWVTPINKVFNLERFESYDKTLTNLLSTN